MNFATAATDNPEARQLEKDITAWLEARGQVVRGSTAKWMSSPDFVIVLGGDGFILEQSALWSNLVPWGAPMVRVNFGRRGFLANVEPMEIFNRLTDLIVRKKYIVQHRERISVSTSLGDGERHVANGLNDVVVERTNPRTILFDVKCGTWQREYMSDGVIFSTRTGSSGYNRSAGGPIIEKNGCIIINPICPIDQAQWEMIRWTPGALPGPSEISVVPKIGPARIVVDGREKTLLQPGEVAYITLHGISRFVEFGDE